MQKNIQTVTVRTAPPYSVSIGRGLLCRSGEYMREAVPLCHTAVVTDSNVAPLYLDRVRESLQSAGYTVSTHIFEAGEENKNLAVTARLLEAFASARLTRRDSVVALGGGVTGDMAGFAAATYLRGIDFVQMPTTLLAAVDASVGGKTAVDLPSGKNLVGAFRQPRAVLCDTECLETLPAERYADGAAEAIKTAVLFDCDLFSRFCEADTKMNTEDIIARCVRYKAGVVERDQNEMGERRLLNLGHTVGHAVEKCSGYTVSHGHAVAVGMAVMARAAERLGWTQASVAAPLCRCLGNNALPICTPFGADELTDAALSDKKRTGDSITLVVPERIGKCMLKDLPIDRLRAVISAGLEV